MKNNTSKPFFNTTIPSDWEVRHFEDVAEIDKSSLSNSTSKEYEFEYISLSDVDSEDFKIETTKQIFGTAPSRARRIVQNGDILMSTVRPNLQGFSFINGEVTDLIASTGFAVITVNQCVNEYLFQYLFSSGISRQFYQLLVGSNYPAINSSDVRKLKIALPPFSEQRVIAHVLGFMDAAINKNNQLIAQKELQKKWLMQNLLTGKKRLNQDLQDGKRRLNQDLQNERINRIESEDYPGNSANPVNSDSDSWKEVRLGDIFERVTRKNEECNLNVVTISAQRGFIRQTDFFNKTIASEITDNYFLVERGEFCYNKSYSNGYPWGATKRLNDFDKAVVTTLYICFGLKNHKKNSGDFFEQFFEANLLDKGLTKIAHEGGRAHGLLNVTPSDFFSLKVSIPTIVEQTAIAKVLQAADKELQLLKAKTEKLREQKKGMMQVLLTGKKRLRVSESGFTEV